MSEAPSCCKVCQPGGCNEPLGFALAKFHGRIVAIHASSSLERSLDSRKKKLRSRKKGENEKRKNYSRFLRKILASALRTNRVEASSTFLQTGREKEAGREGSLRGLFRKCVFQLRCYLGLFEKLDVCRFVR